MTNNQDGQNLFNFDPLRLISCMPGNVYWMDINHIYLGCNNNQLKSFGLKRFEFVGQLSSNVLKRFTDPSQVVENDSRVLSTLKEQICIEEADINNQYRTYISQKNPIFSSDNKCIGMMGISMDVSDKASRKHGEWLIDSINTYNAIKDLPKLTRRQAQCLHYVIHGFSIKDIASKLGLSPRTVEMHINILKDKFFCSTKAELVNKAISSGIVNSIFKSA